MIEAKLIGKIKESMQEVAIGLVEGPAADLAAYNRRVGRYQGLAEALELLNKIMDQDDEDQNRK